MRNLIQQTTFIVILKRDWLQFPFYFCKIKSAAPRCKMFFMYIDIHTCACLRAYKRRIHIHMREYEKKLRVALFSAKVSLFRPAASISVNHEFCIETDAYTYTRAKLCDCVPHASKLSHARKRYAYVDRIVFYGEALAASFTCAQM